MEVRADLQVHILGKISLEQIAAVMERKGIGAVCLMAYSWGDKTLLEAMKKRFDNRLGWEQGYNVYQTDFHSSLPRFYIFGEEVATSDWEMHILSVGATGIKPASAEEIIQQILDKGGMPIIDHPFINPQKNSRDLLPRELERLLSLCQRFHGQIAIEWNGYSVPLLRRLFGYKDSNLAAVGFGEIWHTPVVPTTDLHAWDWLTLQAIGRSHIVLSDIVDNLSTGAFFVEMKDRVLAGRFGGFTPVKRYVSVPHWILAYGWPALKHRIGKLLKYQDVIYF